MRLLESGSQMGIRHSSGSRSGHDHSQPRGNGASCGSERTYGCDQQQTGPTDPFTAWCNSDFQGSDNNFFIDGDGVRPPRLVDLGFRNLLVVIRWPKVTVDGGGMAGKFQRN